MEPIIVLKGYNIPKILKEKKIKNIDSEKNEDPIGIKLRISFLENDVCVLEVTVTIVLDDVYYEIIVEGMFETLEKNLSKNVVKDYLKINGTAILYPYIRSVISVISSLDSESAILLPTLNTNIFKNEDSEDNIEE